MLDAIEAIGYNTLEHRPSISKWTQVALAGARSGAARFHRALRRPMPRLLPPQSRHVGRCRAQRFRHMIARQAAGIAAMSRILRGCRASRALRPAIFTRFFCLPQAKARRALRALRVHAPGRRCFGHGRSDRRIKHARPCALARRAGRCGRRAMSAAIPILPAFADTIERFEIPPRYFHDLILRRGNGFDRRRRIPRSTACANIAIAWPGRWASRACTCSDFTIRTRRTWPKNWASRFN